MSWQATELFYGAIKIRQSAVDGMTRRTLVKVCQWSVTIRFDAKNKRSIEKIHQISYWSVSSKPFYYIPINLLLNYNFLRYVLSTEVLVNSSNLIILLHSGFLEHWNSQKSVCNIWQRFSCLLDEGIPKICKKLNSHDGFFSYLQNGTANSAHLAALFCPSLVCPQKATVRIQFLPYFWNPLIK